MRAYIAIGSNLGDREEIIENGIRSIETQIGPILARSSTWETAPYGVTDQPDFLNLAVLAETKLEPEPLLHTMLAIEKEQHRVRKIHWGPRTLDLDLIYYEDRILHMEDLILPHPDRKNRAFVLGPLAEIAPDYLDPEYHVTIQELYEELKKNPPD